MPRKIKQEVKDYIKAHLDEQPRNQMAKMLGIKVNTLYKYIRLYGGVVKDNSQYEKLRTKIRAMYPTMTAKEIAEELGMTKSQIQFQATKLGLQHDQATIDRINAERSSMLRKYWNTDKYARAGKHLHLLYKREEMLLMSGMKQNTKLRIRRLSPKQVNAKMYLKKKYNYFYSEGEPFVLCFDEETIRCKREQFYSDKFGFKFIDAQQQGG